TVVSVGCSESTEQKTSTPPAQPAPLWGDVPNGKPSCVKGIHLTAWYVGTKKGRARVEKLMAETELNTVVIDIKESEGDVYIPGVMLDGSINTYLPIGTTMKDYLTFLKERGVYTIARVTVFKDQK